MSGLRTPMHVGAPPERGTLRGPARPMSRRSTRASERGRWRKCEPTVCHASRHYVSPPGQVPVTNGSRATPIGGNLAHNAEAARARAPCRAVSLPHRGRAGDRADAARDTPPEAPHRRGVRARTTGGMQKLPSWHRHRCNWVPLWQPALGPSTSQQPSRRPPR